MFGLHLSPSPHPLLGQGGEIPEFLYSPPLQRGIENSVHEREKGSKENPKSDLHDAGARFTENASERWGIRIVVDRPEKRMIEEVKRLQADVQVTLSVLREVEVLEQGGVGLEAAGSSYIGKRDWNVTKAEV